MPRVLCAAVALASTALAGAAPARAADPPPGERVALRLGGPAAVTATGLTVRFVAVTEDSRCPRPASCVWRGNARVELDVAAPGAPPARVALHTLHKDYQSRYAPIDQHPYQVRYAAFVIRIVDLTPYPEVDRTIRPEDYEVTLAVSRP
jgi:hypothetical protein